MSEYYKNAHRYDDIINLPHHQSSERVHMSLHDRAAQFAPFAALSGHEEAIEETARLTDTQVVLDDAEIDRINETLQSLASRIEERPVISITYFKKDTLKSGGAYLSDVGIIKKLDALEHVVILENGMRISMQDIVKIIDV